MTPGQKGSMGNRLYVGNVPFAATNESLTQHFSQAGTVTDVQIMMDKFTGRSRGFAFVTMGSDGDAQNAISQLHGQPCEGRPLTVTEARPREERPSVGSRRDFGGGGGGGGGFSGGGGGRRFERADRDRGDRGERSERSSRRDYDGGGGGRRIDHGASDDGE
jgi:RNA recognition motif-containing protein